MPGVEVAVGLLKAVERSQDVETGITHESPVIIYLTQGIALYFETAGKENTRKQEPLCDVDSIDRCWF